MKKRYLIALAALLMIFMNISPALGAFPTPGSQGDQYGTINAAMFAFAAQEGISPDTFIAIYNAAAVNQLACVNGVLTGPLASQFTVAQVEAAFRVLNDLASFRSSLSDYDTVFRNLNCGTVAGAGIGAGAAGAGGEGARGILPKTGMAALTLLAASSAIGSVAAWRLIRKNAA